MSAEVIALLTEIRDELRKLNASLGRQAISQRPATADSSPKAFRPLKARGS